MFPAAMRMWQVCVQAYTFYNLPLSVLILMGNKDHLCQKNSPSPTNDRNFYE